MTSYGHVLNSSRNSIVNRSRCLLAHWMHDQMGGSSAVCDSTGLRYNGKWLSLVLINCRLCQSSTATHICTRSVRTHAHADTHRRTHRRVVFAPKPTFSYCCAGTSPATIFTKGCANTSVGGRCWGNAACWASTAASSPSLTVSSPASTIVV